MKNIKDYLHLYLGCEVDFIDDNGDTQTGKLVGISNGAGVIKLKGFKYYRKEDLQLHLIPLSAMTEEEMRECGNLDYDFSGDPHLNRWTWKDFNTLQTSNQFLWLLSKHFDLFDLIPEGLAIDATKVEQLNK